MGNSEKQKALDAELIQECYGYHEWNNKPDGAYIRKGSWFYNINKIKRLIASGADVNAKRWDGSTPLHRAVWGDNIAIAKPLIDSGANVNAKDSDGSTPLHWAVRRDNIAFAKLLIASGANIKVKDKWGRAFLHWAKSNEMKTLLIEHGAE